MAGPERLIDISERPMHLSLRHGGLLVLRGDGLEATIPVEEIIAVLAAHPQVSFTHAALSALAGAGVMVVCSDERRMPSAMLLPVEGNFVQAERFRRQAQVGEPTRKRLWQQLVQAKIRAQAQVLRRIRKPDPGLEQMASRVRSGDPDNLEAHAARRYWPQLFPGGFRRCPEDPDQNRLLNYGYAVLRAVIARCVVGAGLHPSLGLNHSNRYNAFCLADDLMEPLRPLVDLHVAGIVEEAGPAAELDKAVKARLIDGIIGRVRLGEEERRLVDAAFRLSSSLQAVFEGKARKLLIPELPG